jgi:hypothetical protein
MALKVSTPSRFPYLGIHFQHDATDVGDHEMKVAPAP